MAEPIDPPQPLYPTECPKCHQLTGQPYNVVMSGMSVPITVYLECEACKHKWTADAPSPLMRRRDKSMQR